MAWVKGKLKGKTKDFTTMVPENLVRRIVGNFPDAIVTDEDGYLDFEESVYNVSAKLLDKLPESQQYSVFGRTFENEDELYEHLYKNLPGLRERMELYVMGEI